MLPQDPTLGNSKLVNQAIDPFKKEKLTTDKIEDTLKTSDLRTLHVYIITKLHKPRNLCLSVVNSVNFYTAYKSKYIDYNLHFIVKQIDTTFIDTSIFMNKMSQSMK